MRRKATDFRSGGGGPDRIALLLGGAFRDSSPASPAVVPQRRARYADERPRATRRRDRPAAGDAAREPERRHALDQLGLAYQQRARETGDPTYYTKSGEALHRALRLAPRDLLATSGLGSLALSRHRFREALALGRARARDLADDGAELRRHRRRARRARPLPRRRFAPSTRWRRSSRASRRTRASRTRASCSATSAARSRRCSSRVDAAAGPGRGRGVDARAARQALLVRRPARRGRGASTARRCARSPTTRTRTTRSRRSRPRAGDCRGRDRARAAGRRTGFRCRSSSRSLGDLLHVAGAEPARARRQYATISRDRAPAARERRAHRSRDGALRRRPRDPASARRSRSRAGAARASVDRRRRRARVGARAERPLRRGAALLEALAPARHARRAQVLPPRDDRALPRPPRRTRGRGSRARSASTRTSRSCGRRSRGGTRDEEASSS